jgi:hypothetical protein
MHRHLARGPDALETMRLVPDAHVPEDDDREERRQRIGGDAFLAPGEDDQRRGERSERRSEIAAKLKERLRQPVPAARRHPRHPRRFGVKHRRAEADKGGRNQDHRIAVRNRQQQEPDQREHHAGRQRPWHRSLVGHEAHQRLEQRRRELEGESDEADLGEIEVIVGLERRVDRRQQRLHHVVEQVGEADREENGEGRFARRLAARQESGSVHRSVAVRRTPRHTAAGGESATSQIAWRIPGHRPK